MKYKLLKGSLLPLMVLLVFACNSKKEEPAAAVIDKEQIKKEIQAKEDEFAATYNSGELKEIGYYADDAVSYSQNKAPLVGRQAIIEFYKANMDSVPNSTKISFTTNEILVSNDGLHVVEIGYYRLNNATTDSLVNSGNYMSIFEKRDGKYVCIRDMSTSDRPLE